MYDPFESRLKAPEDKATESRALKLVSYLSTRKEPQTTHAETVMAFVTQKAASDHRINRLEAELENYRMRDRDQMMAMEPGHERGRIVPRVMPIPADARSVEVKF